MAFARAFGNGGRRQLEAFYSPLSVPEDLPDEGTRLAAAVQALAVQASQATPNALASTEGRDALCNAASNPEKSTAPASLKSALLEVEDAAQEAGAGKDRVRRLLDDAADQFSTPPSSPREALRDVTPQTANSANQQEASSRARVVGLRKEPTRVQGNLRARVQRLEERAGAKGARGASEAALQEEVAKAKERAESLEKEVQAEKERSEQLASELQDTREALAEAHSAEASQREKARRAEQACEEAEKRADEAEEQKENLRLRLNQAEERAAEAERKFSASNAKLQQATGALEGAKAAMRRAIEDKRKAERALASRPANLE